MPYVTDECKRSLQHRPPQTAGELTYVIQQAVVGYLDHCDKLTGNNYTTYGTVLLALRGCEADFVDRILLPYEYMKCAENGDVWPSHLIPTNR